MKGNRFTFGIGTIGRDMVYSMVSMYLIFYLTDVIKLDTATFAVVTGIILAARIFDALTDPVMGVIVDNTNTRWGKFKPWIAFGMLTAPVATILLFTDFGLTGASYAAVFAVIYFGWGVLYTTNDISYWSMLPSLSTDQREREKIGSVARICANVGLFFVVAGIIPITEALGAQLGSLQKGYFAFAIIVGVIMLAGQSVTLFGVKEPKSIAAPPQSTSLRGMIGVIVKNDQLLFTAVCMSLFMTGYVTTTTFGIYFFKYAYGDEGMYPIFALILGVSQILALAVFPLLGKLFERGKLYTFAIGLIAAGYITFFFAPTTTMLFIGIAGVLLFVGQAFVQLLMLMFLADSVDYGHWKLGKRNDSVSFSIQPFINKLGGALGSGVVAVVLIFSGIKEAETPADVTPQGLLLMKTAMLIFPLICIVVSYVIYRKQYKIDSRFYAKIMGDLRERGEIK